jgi:hypothetical protein
MSDATWAALGECWDTRQLMDFVFTVGGCHMLAMALNTFGVEPRPPNPRRRTEWMAHFPKPAAGSWTKNWPELAPRRWRPGARRAAGQLARAHPRSRSAGRRRPLRSARRHAVAVATAARLDCRASRCRGTSACPGRSPRRTPAPAVRCLACTSGRPTRAVRSGRAPGRSTATT